MEGNFEATLWRHRWRHHHESYFCCHNLGRSFHIWGQIAAVFNISKFSKWPPFSGRDKLFAGCYAGSWIYRRDCHEYFRYFEFFYRRSSSNNDGDKSISKFDLLCDLVTKSMTSWIRVYINVIIISWNLCTESLMMISLLGFSYHENVVISFLKEYRGPTFKPPVTSSVTSSL